MGVSFDEVLAAMRSQGVTEVRFSFASAAIGLAETSVPRAEAPAVAAPLATAAAPRAESQAAAERSARLAAIDAEVHALAKAMQAYAESAPERWDLVVRRDELIDEARALRDAVPKPDANDEDLYAASGLRPRSVEDLMRQCDEQVAVYESEQRDRATVPDATLIIEAAVPGVEAV